MTFTQTAIPGVWIVESDVRPDDRGAFTRIWTSREFGAHGLETRLAQCTSALNTRRGTIRGMHFQAAPDEETKLVRVASGVIYDVAIDLRRDSPTFRKWVGVELSADNGRMLYVPRGCAHGYQTLVDGADVTYFISADYEPSLQRGVRWNDPAFAVVWPLGAPAAIHPRDAAYPDFA